MKKGKFDRPSSDWIKDANKVFDEDKDKSTEDILREIYKQHQKLIDYKNARRQGIDTKHIPDEIRMEADVKISCLEYLLANKSEQSTNTIIDLTEQTKNYTKNLITLTKWIIALTVVMILFGFGQFFQTMKSNKPCYNTIAPSSESNQKTNLKKK